MTSHFYDVSVPEFLGDLSVGVILALIRKDTGAVKELIDRLAQYEQNARTAQMSDMALYFRVLGGLLKGDDVSTLAEALMGPYRAGYERIIEEVSRERSASDAETTSEMSLQDWLAGLASLVVTTMKQGDAQDQAALEQELAALAGRVPAGETDMRDFIEALRSVLRGEDTRRHVLKLQTPYRDAYLSLLQLLTAGDTADFALHHLLDRIEHNTTVALTQGNAEIRQAVAASLADLETRLPQDLAPAAYLGPLMAGACALLLGKPPPAAVTQLPQPYAQTWQNILAVTRQG